MKTMHAVTTLAMLTAASADAQTARKNPLVAEYCRTDPRLVVKSGAPLSATPLAREPNASKIAAVWRRDHRGCPMPIVLDDNIGANRR